MKQNPFFKQADLMLRLLPHIDEDSGFALHGGTALNFFVRDMPRISVDIDLTYLSFDPREDALVGISKSLHALAWKFEQVIPGIRADERKDDQGRTSKLIVSIPGALVKVEPNLVMRGSVWNVEERILVKRAEELFEKSVSVKTLPLAALYGGKVCAALDRQHPRDLFDIKLLFENEGFTEEIRKAFLVCLISGNRPMNEVLNPKRKDLHGVFEKEFLGMSLLPVKVEELEEALGRLTAEIEKRLTREERRFLLSFKEGNPVWEMLGVEDADKLPAVQWKLANLKRMDIEKHSRSVEALRKVLGVEG